MILLKAVPLICTVFHGATVPTVFSVVLTILCGLEKREGSLGNLKV